MGFACEVGLGLICSLVPVSRSSCCKNLNPFFSFIHLNVYDVDSMSSWLNPCSCDKYIYLESLLLLILCGKTYDGKS